MRTKNIDLLEKVGQKPRSSKSRTRRNVKVLGTSIEERPKSVDEPVLLTLVERKTRFEKIFKIASQRADVVDQTLRSFIQSLNGLDGQIFKTITLDKGSEFANLSSLPDETDVYFCHPFASFERGTSENQHKIIRRFLPKQHT